MLTQLDIRVVASSAAVVLAAMLAMCTQMQHQIRVSGCVFHTSKLSSAKQYCADSPGLQNASRERLPWLQTDA
jgi:1-aminocyclopropane-1-carboxylate deaminase/D-cysteine desulfhydrase-like pyridoxal-dependent ACC family enzyme